MDGVLVVDKPAGMTSHDVVARARSALGTKRVGHGGTLDPDATGVLVLGIGRATRFLSYAQESPKRYVADVRFGITTSTLDASGDVVQEREVSLTEAGLKAALDTFRGDIEQVPPMVSAVKIGGERLYEKARRGEVVERPPRKVTIYELEATDVDVAAGTARLMVTCSGGTYIRSLAADLGEELGCGAHLTFLRRTAAGGFDLSEAVPLADIGPDRVLGLAEVVRDLPTIEVGEEEATSVTHGRSLASRPGIEPGPVALVHADRLIAVYVAKDGVLKPERVVSQ